MFFKSRCSLQICKLCKFHRKAPVLEYLFNSLGPSQLYYKETPTQEFSYEICEIFNDNFFTKHLRWLLLAMGVPYLVKLQVTFFIKKVELHSPKIFAEILKKLYFRKVLLGALLQNVFQRLRIEKLKTTFHFLKEKKEKKMTKIFRVCYFGQYVTFSICYIFIFRQVPEIEQFHQFSLTFQQTMLNSQHNFHWSLNSLTGKHHSIQPTCFSQRFADIHPK